MQHNVGPLGDPCLNEGSESSDSYPLSLGFGPNVNQLQVQLDVARVTKEPKHVSATPLSSEAISHDTVEKRNPNNKSIDTLIVNYGGEWCDAGSRGALNLEESEVGGGIEEIVAGVDIPLVTVRGDCGAKASFPPLGMVAVECDKVIQESFKKSQEDTLQPLAIEGQGQDTDSYHSEELSDEDSFFETTESKGVWDRGGLLFDSSEEEEVRARLIKGRPDGKKRADLSPIKQGQSRKAPCIQGKTLATRTLRLGPKHKLK
ncbi:hypothetical protein PIB30_053659 [Stylosanthes scabra]|uniref:Uncharacterized protein n=1 Tax=Stylosanthes scabra TaxID=79078 RepID=A0ABU6QI71_9FABA|nr:hypothetical protein [Stylosanthes scabra]